MAPDAFCEFNIPRSAIVNELHTVHFFSPFVKEFQYSPATVEAVASDRVRFDQELFRMAKDAAVEMHLGRRVTQIEIDDNAVRVQCGDRGPAITARIYFSIVTAAIAADLMAEGLSRDKLSSAFLSEYEKRWRR